MPSMFSLFGTAVAVAGADKLAPQRGYRRLNRELDLARRTTRGAGVAEIAGGLLMIPRATRGLGAALVAATSTAMLVREIGKRQTRLAAPRGLVMLGALAALIAPDVL